ncbi:MAG: protein-ADP-ribose hydrolase [Clostridia bacterium]|nr:protein-ADP-ribose hydrolase [Clostridia bacterium]
MNNEERRKYLTRYLLDEGGYKDEIPSDEEGQRRLLRSLFNVRMPMETTEEFLKIQDEYLSEEIAKKGITDGETLCFKDDIAVWKGDITTLKVGAIVNAANSRMLGCFAPCHYCIDNAIHTFSGIQLRSECYDIMKRQGKEEPTGKAKLTRAYNLPCDYVLHTVGPIVYGEVTKKEENELASCYESCLTLAEENGIKSVAFCCISTGVFSFPNEKAAEIAVKTVKGYKERTKSDIKIIFNVFKENDYEIYRRLLGYDR